MKILLIHPHIHLGGAEKQLLHLSYNLMKRGHEVRICCLTKNLKEFPDFLRKIDIVTPSNQPKWRRKAIELTSKVRVHKRWKLSQIATLQSYELIELAMLVRKELRKEDFDILNPHNFPAHWSTFLCDKPIVWHCNDVLFGRIEEWSGEFIIKKYSRLISYFDSKLVKAFLNGIIVNNDYLSSIVLRRYRIRPFIIYPGVDYEFFSKGNPQRAIEKFGLDPASFKILCVGALVPSKNQINLIKSLGYLLKMIERIQVILVGEGFMRQQLYEEAKRMSIHNQVIFTGYISEEDLRDLYHACDLNLNLTLVNEWSLTPLEAFCAEKISLVSRHSALATFLAKNGLGEIILDPTPREIAGLVSKVYYNLDEFQKLAKYGKELVKNMLTWEVYTCNCIKIFEKFTKR